MVGGNLAGAHRERRAGLHGRGKVYSLTGESTWSDPSAYARKARELAEMFRANFEKFAEPELAKAGPLL